MSSLASRSANALADRDTPLIRNSWYLAALGEEVGRTPISRTVVETKVLLYRTAAGEAVALHDRCMHRSYPLSRGTLDGDSIVCGYHGMTFGPDGRCTHLPAGEPARSGNIGVDRYPLVERGPILWVWVGDADKADAALVPEYDWLSSPEWVCSTGSAEINASYVALHENLLDLTHFTYLHAGTVGTPEYARSPLEVRRERGRIGVFRTLRDQEPPPAFGKPMGLAGKRVDRFSESWFVSPGASVGQGSFEDPTPAPGAQARFHFRLAHIPTPMTRQRFHYQWFVGRDFALEDPEVTVFLNRMASTAFAEDVDALQAIDAVLDVETAPFRELSFVGDKAGVEMRRTLSRLAREEAEQA